MTLFEAAILGAIQGATEFIPVSSTGHLVLTERFLDVPANFTFAVLLNVGTLLALILFFRKRILLVLIEIFIKRNVRYAGLLILATIPAGLLAIIFDDSIERLNTNAWVVAVALLIGGVLMVLWGKERVKPSIKKQADIKLSNALVVGFAQAVALIPGVSRSGSTILASLGSGFSKKAAAEFSFMMAIPIIFAATLRTLLSSDGRHFISTETDLFLIGNVTSFIFGLVAVKFLIGALGKYGLKGFGWYRIGFSIFLAVLLLTNVI